VDLGKLGITESANAGFDLVLIHPKTGDPTDVFIKVLGRDSGEYRQLSLMQQRRRLQKLVSKPGRASMESVSDADMDRDSAEIAAACTKAWGTNLGEIATEEEVANKDKLLFNGEWLVCTREAALMVYIKEPWIREQVESAILDRANFSKG